MIVDAKERLKSFTEEKGRRVTEIPTAQSLLILDLVERMEKVEDMTKQTAVHNLNTMERFVELLKVVNKMMDIFVPLTQMLQQMGQIASEGKKDNQQKDEWPEVLEKLNTLKEALAEHTKEDKENSDGGE